MTLPFLKAATLGGVRHGFFTRQGGVSEGIYAALNCGFGSGDARQAVAENRDRVRRTLDAGALNTVHQVHGTVAVEVEAGWDPLHAPKADAMATRMRGVALGALAADCAPVLFADPEAGVIGSAHAGWRGALAGVTDSAIASMERLGAHRTRIRAAVGPCIAQASYEVGPELREAFLAAKKGYDRFFSRNEAGRFQFDLKGYVAARLCAAGLAEVEIVPVDTYADEARCFSFRRATHRGEADYGRMIAAIALD
jgi:YfiH family protein